MKTAAALQGRLNTELAPSGENTESNEADTGKQETPVSAEAMVESSPDRSVIVASFASSLGSYNH